jgi:hypothetical protein
MDYQRAKDNLSRILTDEERFAEISKSIFDAIDTDNSGTFPASYLYPPTPHLHCHACL